MQIGDLQETIAGRFSALAPESPVRAAAESFADSQVGLVTVLDNLNRLVGVVSKSDLVRHLAAAGRIDAPIAWVMTREVTAGSSADDLRATWDFMKRRGLQNLPVIETDRRVVGTLDIRDAVQALLELEQMQEAQLISYIAGVGYR
jgi:CBS domain-containing protein